MGKEDEEEKEDIEGLVCMHVVVNVRISCQFVT